MNTVHGSNETSPGGQFWRHLLHVIKGMLSAFGFLKLSCTLFIDCFVKPKRKLGQSGSRTSDSDEEEYKPTIKVNRKTKPFLKKGVKHMVRVLPPRPIEKPQISLFDYFLNNKRRTRNPDGKMPTLSQDRVDSITQRGMDQVKRRGPLPSNKPPIIESQDWKNQTSVGPTTPVKGQYCGTSVIPMDIESQCSLSSDDYPCDSISLAGSEFPSVEDLDTVSLDSPRPGLETSVNKLGVNPTFFASKSGEEEEKEEDDGFERGFQSARTRQQLRRIHSIVETNASFKHKAQGSSNQNLLLNPAFGSMEKEECEEVEMETKLKSLKSVVKNGCRASSSVLVESKYIGHTSFNPTYGDLSPSESSCSESTDSELPDDSGEMHLSGKSSKQVLKDERVVLHEGVESWNGNFRTRLTPSVPKIALERASLDPEMTLNNMGTLTWRNIAYSQSSESEEEEDFQEGNTSREGRFTSAFIKRFPESFPTPFPSPFESSILSPTSSSVVESLSSSTAEEVVKRDAKRNIPNLEGDPTHQTPFHPSNSFPPSHSVKTFEEVDLHSREVDIERSIQDSDSSSSEPSFSNCVSNAKQDRAIVVAVKAQKTPPMKKATKIAGSSLRHTRWVLRSLRLLISRFDPFSQTMDKQK